MYTVTDGHGNITTTTKIVVVPYIWKGQEVDPFNVPGELTLDQNYPNPFNPTTAIQYGIPNDGHVTLSVYDMYSRKVQTLVDDVLKAGTYTKTFNAESLPSGMYMYVLEANGKVLTRTMNLVK
jgi:hypothetical protein